MRIKLWGPLLGLLGSLLLSCRSVAPPVLPSAAALAAPGPEAAKVFNVRTFGAMGDGTADDAGALQRAIDACTAAGGGRVLVPTGGTYLAGPFALKSHVEFCIESGARVLAHPDLTKYTTSAFGANASEGTRWISADRAEQITLCGGGSIDGNAAAFLGPATGDIYAVKPGPDHRPHVLTLVGVRGLRIRDLAVGNAAYWNIHLAGCSDVAISDVTVRNDQRVPNSDGIDLDHCRDVRISNCRIESGDDAICLKNRREYAEFGPCENIVVANCTLTSRSCAFKIGSENVDSIRHVVVSNCLIAGSNRGVGIQNRDEGTVMDVVFANLIIESRYFSEGWWGRAEPIYVTAFRRPAGRPGAPNWRFPSGQTTGPVGAVRDIYFSNVKCRSENGIYVSGEAGQVAGIYFDQVDVQLDKTTAHPGGVYDRRPATQDELFKAPTSGFYFDRATGIVVRNSSVRWGPHRPAYFAHALESHAVAGLQISGALGESAFPQQLAATKIDPIK